MQKSSLITVLIAAGSFLLSPLVRAQVPTAWSQPQEPFKIFGNTYYVGTRGLGSILITSKEGHVLIDGALPTSVQPIADSIRALGFRVEDVKLILNSHVHFDHAGGLAGLQKLSGARVLASAVAAKVLRSGEAGNDDPQFGRLPKIDTVNDVDTISDHMSISVGPTRLTAYYTPGHTPGGTSWTWQSCEGDRCLNMAYVDSLNPISSPGYLYTDPNRDPNGVKQLEHSFGVVAALPCDVVIAPHPELVDLLGKLAKREQGEATAFIDPDGCRKYVQAARKNLDKRIADERK